MNLRVQHFRLSEVAEAGLDLAGFASAGVPSAQPTVTVIGQCFAFHNEPLKAEAQREGISWHEWLLRRTLAGLWEQSCKKKTYVCYTLHPGVVRLFFCSKPSRFPAKFHELISATSAYIEQGQDSFPPVFARSLAFWEAPCTAVVLWPRGLRGETDDRGRESGHGRSPSLQTGQAVLPHPAFQSVGAPSRGSGSSPRPQVRRSDVRYHPSQLHSADSTTG